MATVYEVLDKLAGMLEREIVAAAGAPAGYARGQMHAYATWKLVEAIRAVLGMLPPEEARLWIAQRKALLVAAEFDDGPYGWRKGAGVHA